MTGSPPTAQALLGRGLQLQRSGQLDAAADVFSSVLASDPDQPDALHLLGVIRAQQNHVEESIALITRAVELRPRFSEALFNLGRLHHAQNNYQDAVNAYVRAGRFKRGYSRAWINLGAVYADLEMFDEAVKALETGLKSDPKNTALFDGLCRVYKRQARFEDCVASADRGLKINPESPELWIHRSEACFALGRLAQGWKDYAWRFRHPDNPNRPRPFPLPHWQGEDLSGKSILVQTEQGPGETFLFSSMLTDVIAQAQRCTIVTPDRLRPVLARSFPEADVLPEETTVEPPEHAEIQCSIADLGQWLRPTMESFPDRPEHIKPDPEQTAAFQAKYARKFNGTLVVGLAWKTTGVAAAPSKSAVLEAFKPILLTPGVSFVSVQYGDTIEELELIKRSTGVEIYTEQDLDPVADLDKHVAQIAALDLVVSTSNTAAHIAGALGVPVWCLLPNRLGEGLRWNWFWERDTSPWYKSAKLYRQADFGSWFQPVAHLTVDLVRLSAEHNGGPFDVASHLLALTTAAQNAGQLQSIGVYGQAALDAGSKAPAAYALTAKWARLNKDTEHARAILDLARSTPNAGDDVEVLLECAINAMVDNNFDRAVDDLETIRKQTKSSANLLVRLCQAYRFSGQLDKAIDVARTATMDHPDSRNAWFALAMLLIDANDTDRALTILEKIVVENRADVEAVSAIGIAHLVAGDFNHGWTAYRDRLRQATVNISYARFPQKIWAGESLNDANVLVWTEQGIGEEILTSTLLPETGRKARSVTLLCSERMVPLLKRSFPDFTVEERSEPVSSAAVNPDIDFQMSMSDLGSALRPSVDSFLESRTKQALVPDSELVERLRSRYKEQAGHRPLVGLSWHSETPDLGALKSLSILHAAEFVRECDAAFVCVQYSPQPDHLTELSNAAANRWIFDPSVDAMQSMDLAAAQCAALDYVVTISNSAAHLAGALGIEAALLVPPNTGRHWYWMRGHDQSLWYPSVRLFEVSEDGTWREALQDIKSRVESLRLSA